MLPLTASNMLKVIVFMFSTILQKAHALDAAAAMNQSLRSRGTAKAEIKGYTQNSLCRQNNCVNPIFPGLNDLPRLEALTWQCATTKMTQQYMDFCKDAVPYDPALPSPQEAKQVAELVKAQDDAAMTMFVYHLNGMGYESWDFREPWLSDNDCVRAVWKMTCFTYFPRANTGCQNGQVSFYQRPCQSSCHNYIAKCGVECCDESVQCVFTDTKTNDKGQLEIIQTGYVNEDGPSAKCTGNGRRATPPSLALLLSLLGLHLASGTSSQPVTKPQPRKQLRQTWRLAFVAAAFVLLAAALQGCDGGISRHATGNWRSKTNYLNEFKYLAPGARPQDAILNSCAQTDIPATQQCSGRGYCKAFSKNGATAQQIPGKPLAFCMCDAEWADPECTTRRKSQTTAWFLSVFLGPFGADYFYLGFPLWGLGKLCTLGGLGTWWLVDVVRISAGPVYAYDYRTANDLSHWAAVTALVFVCMLAGFVVSVESYMSQRRERRAKLAEMQCEEELRQETYGSLASRSQFDQAHLRSWTQQRPTPSQPQMRYQPAY